MSQKSSFSEANEETPNSIQGTINLKDYVLVAVRENDSSKALPLESDGTLLLTTLQGNFPGATGLEFKRPQSDIVFGVRIADGRLHPPTDENSWGSEIYKCIFAQDTISAFVQIAGNDEDPLWVPTEDDGSLSLATIRSVFPGTCGLKFKTVEQEIQIAVKISNGRFIPPFGKKGWGCRRYLCVFSEEKKNTANTHQSSHNTLSEIWKEVKRISISWQQRFERIKGAKDINIWSGSALSLMCEIPRCQFNNKKKISEENIEACGQMGSDYKLKC
ncbi:hypothetical protein HA402_011889 [Bradysia odoriphaga]|nr:hypothetical protein HA402_011889 [Bradysia odoriphaga]